MSTVELSIGGMTCASCASRIEKKLNRLDGVSASVNFATEKARVELGDHATAQDLVATVEAAGYRATLPEAEPDDQPPAEDAAAALRRRLLICLALSVPVIAMAMAPALQVPNWQWLSLTLAAPVVVWGAWPFHVATWTNLRHRAATMDTLISLGTLAAFGWSLYALFWGTAGQTGMTHAFELTVGHTDGSANIYLEVAAGVTTFILAGRYFGRGPNAAPVTRYARCCRWARRPCRCAGPTGNTGYRSNCSAPGTNSWSDPARRWPPTASSSKARRRWTPRC